MFGDEEQIVLCYACEAPMNISTVGPYSRVICPECQTENRVKNQFGPYIVARRHAIGGMSSVFIANDETLGREVAVKILSEEYSKDETRIAAFKEEARLTASFSHPHVVRVYTTGWAYGWFFIAMEYVPGGHLEHRIRDLGKIPEKEMLPLAIQIAEGLKGAQMAGLIHRDVKPGNILLDAEGNAKIVDFGLALVTSGGKAQATEIWATPFYVPPEAIEGGVEDFRADIYAFGATLYHALAGVPPCNEESMSSSLLKAAKQKVVPLKKVAPELCAETCTVITRAMAYRPEDRFGSYDEMISGLKRALGVAQGDIRSEGEGSGDAEGRARLKRRKNERVLIMGVVGVLVAVVLGVFLVGKIKGKSPTKEPGNVVMAGVGGSDGQGSSQEEIARRYMAARAAMRSADYRSAEKLFVEILENRGVQEPTRTWAGLEAVVAAYMDGRSAEAGNNAKLVEDHISSKPDGLGAGFATSLLPVLQKLGKMPFLDERELEKKGGDEGAMACFIAGLKNWEQGGLDKAVGFFREVVGKGPNGEDAVMGWYREAAQLYLNDYDRLSSGTMAAEPRTVDDCRKVLADLNELQTLLKTKGRAKYNVSSRRTDVELLERNLRKANGG
jgi:eukaryotic-like serine/threonine-protein kinase